MIPAQDIIPEYRFYGLCKCKTSGYGNEPENVIRRMENVTDPLPEMRTCSTGGKPKMAEVG
jgi:hypothetical protein